MKTRIAYKLMIAGLGLLASPTVLLAQKEKEKSKEKVQTIVITRTGDENGKMTIEVDGDNVKVNGKDAKDNKDVHVNVTTTTGARTRIVTAPGQAMSWSFDDGHMSLYEEDANRAMLGVTTEGDDKGAEIITVNKESGAEKAGLKKGDVITRIGSEDVEGPGDVTKAIRNHKPGDKVEITYLRDGKEQKATAELSKWKGIKMNPVRVPSVGMGTFRTPEPPRANFEQFENLASTYYGFGRPRLGLSIQDDEDGKGAKVLEVEDDGAAAKAGLKEGDIITGIDDKEVKGTDDVTKTIRANKEKYNYSFKVIRDGKTQTLEVKMPRKLKTADL